MMSAGEKEIILASEEVQRRNITAMLDHGNKTREFIRKLEKKVDLLQSQIRIQDEKFEELKTQLVAIQMKLYAGGT